MYAFCRTLSALPSPSWLRMAGTLAVTAQSPKETSTLVRVRTWRTISRLSSLQMAPSISHTSTCSGYSFTSMTGLKTISALPASSMRNSSRSRKDMWQPEQPPNQTVAMRKRGALPVSGFVLIRRFVSMLVGGQVELLSFSSIHCFFSRAVTMNSSLVRSRSISPTVEPLLKSAPVGQDMTHLPHLVHVSDAPHGWLWSLMMRAWPPRPETFLVPAPSMCQQTRTQRLHRMQRLWSMPYSGCVLSTSHFGKQYS